MHSFCTTKVSPSCGTRPRSLFSHLQCTSFLTGSSLALWKVLCNFLLLLFCIYSVELFVEITSILLFLDELILKTSIEGLCLNGSFNWFWRKRRYLIRFSAFFFWKFSIILLLYQRLSNNSRLSTFEWFFLGLKVLILVQFLLISILIFYL